MYNYPMMDANNWGWGWAMMLMMLFWGAFLIVIIIIVIRLLKSHSTRNTTQRIDPLDIAKERYVKGEITKEEFEQLKIDLK